MANFTMSDEAYNEFVEFLKENNVTDTNIRINLGGFACSGPVFNISVSEPSENDVYETIKDITFIAEKTLINEFEGFILSSTAENDGRGMSIKAINPGEGGCGSCGGGCH